MTVGSRFNAKKMRGLLGLGARISVSLALMAFIYSIGSSQADAFVVQKTGNRYQQWNQADIPVRYRVNPSGFSVAGIPQEQGIAAIRSAFQTWEDVATASIAFAYDGETSVAIVSKDGTNTIFWVTEQSAWTYGDDASAHTTTFVNGSTGRIEQVDIALNATPLFLAGRAWTATGEAGKLDLQSVVTHEVGHVVGLDHVDNPDATMYPYSSLGDIGRRTLHQDDIDGVSFLYPVVALTSRIERGDNQAGQPGVALEEPLAVKVTDGSGAPVAGQFVIFDLQSGTGALGDVEPVMTDATGVASTSLVPGDEAKVVVRAVGPGLQELIFWENNRAPVLSWTGEVGYESDGLDPELGYGSTFFRFRVKYTDGDNDRPSVAMVWIDMDGDGVFEAGEWTLMSPSGSTYSSGVIYSTLKRIPYSSGSSNISYYFEFRDRADFAPAGGLPAGFSPATAIDGPVVLQTPGNSAPVFVQSDPQTVFMDVNGKPTAFSLTLNASDIDGNTIYWSISEPAAHGVASVGVTGTQKTITYIPDQDYSGTDSFTVLIDDYLGGTDTLTVFVYIGDVNRAPTDLLIDNTTVLENKPLGTVVGIFSSQDPDPVDTHTYSLVPGDGGVDNASFFIVGDELRTAEIFDHESRNTYSIRVRTEDLQGGFFEKQFTITVMDVNDAPVAVADDYTMGEDTALSVAAPGVLGNDSDVDGDALSAVLASGPSHGTLVLNANGSFTYTPEANYNGSDSFTYKASDGSLDKPHRCLGCCCGREPDQYQTIRRIEKCVQILSFVEGGRGLLRERADVEILVFAHRLFDNGKIGRGRTGENQNPQLAFQHACEKRSAVVGRRQFARQV